MSQVTNRFTGEVIPPAAPQAPEADDCATCLTSLDEQGEFGEAETPFTCAHRIHTVCLQHWDEARTLLEETTDCPLCRAEPRPGSPLHRAAPLFIIPQQEDQGPFDLIPRMERQKDLSVVRKAGTIALGLLIACSYELVIRPYFGTGNLFSLMSGQ